MLLLQLIDQVGCLLNVSPEAMRRPSKARFPARASGYLVVRKLKLKGIEVNALPRPLRSQSGDPPW